MHKPSDFDSKKSIKHNKEYFAQVRERDSYMH